MIETVGEMANEQNLKEPYNSEVAREMQKRSVEKRKQNKAQREAARAELEKIYQAKGYSGFREALENLAERAKENDNSLKLALQILGEDPGETVNIGQTTPFKIEVEIER